MTGQTKGKIRLWLATAVVILVVFAVWKFIDYRMRPPPPPGKTMSEKSK